MGRKNNTPPTPPALEPKKEDQVPQGDEGSGLENQENNGGVDNTPNPDGTKEDQVPQGDESNGLENQENNGGVDNTPNIDKNQNDKKTIYKIKRPLLHNGKTYSVDDDVTGLFDDEELERLLKMGAIVEV